jgi:hypothetical protein
MKIKEMLTADNDEKKWKIPIRENHYFLQH